MKGNEISLKTLNDSAQFWLDKSYKTTYIKPITESLNTV